MSDFSSPSIENIVAATTSSNLNGFILEAFLCGEQHSQATLKCQSVTDQGIIKVCIVWFSLMPRVSIGIRPGSKSTTDMLLFS